MSLLAIVGPTAAGKSDIALRVARETGASILSVDSMQVYRGMDIGTAKPSAADRQEIPHGMIDLVDPSHDHTVAEFQAEARRFLASRSGPVIAVGGSGLHFRSVVDPLDFPAHDPELRADLEALDRTEQVERLLDVDPDAGEVIDLQNPRRVVRALEISHVTGQTPTQRASSEEYAAVQDYRALVPFVGVGVDPGPEIGQRVRARIAKMVEEGLVDEVRRLAPHLGRNARQAVGYKELLPVVEGTATIDEAIEQIEQGTLALVRRQRTYFGRDPRITWLDPETSMEDAVAYCLEVWRPT